MSHLSGQQLAPRSSDLAFRPTQRCRAASRSIDDNGVDVTTNSIDDNGVHATTNSVDDSGHHGGGDDSGHGGSDD